MAAATFSGSLIIYGEFFSTLDKLAAAQGGNLRRDYRLRADRGDVVLRDAKIHAGEVRTNPAGALSA